MKLPWFPRRTLRRKTSPDALLAPDAWRWLTLLVLCLGLTALFWPHEQPWQRWTLARQGWDQAVRTMSARESAGLDDARRTQAQVDVCENGTLDGIDVCLRDHVTPPSGSLGQLVVAQAWVRVIDQARHDHPQALIPRVRHGLAHLGVLRRSSMEDTLAWDHLTRAFQDNVNACAAVMPGLLCAWWARGDEQAWGLDWDMTSGVVLPSSDAQAIPSFVHDREQAWTALLASPPAVRVTGKTRKHAPLSTAQPVQALSEEAAPDDPRDRGRFRSDRARERDVRPVEVEQGLEASP